ncbi:hypothetical protein BIFANG_03403 [Bifidobacterium angulatum DSM 20098 = JCM 7096]|uniref:Uncharacterized protein n=1 Tax=Bifidobacterium angulatum DSM 20098 = JCM 7096 TaxID=518635 RepID=C4FGD3_9BIFI|nr:hypothetical protein BIFANG_03403 [Bifidobacterium angulatum DSM 20098 = JCM 7096]
MRHLVFTPCDTEPRLSMPLAAPGRRYPQTIRMTIRMTKRTQPQYV